MDWAGVAQLVTSLALLVGAIGGFRVARRVKQIDAAVNGKPPGETTMVKQVQDLTDKAFPPDPGNGDAVLPLLRRLVADFAEHKEKHG